MNVTFSNPGYLFLLLFIPLIIVLYVITLKTTKKKALKFANFAAIERVSGVSFFSKNITTTILSCIIVLLLVLAASGTILHKQAYASSFSFVLGIDVSRSMEAKDIYPTRIDAAKETANMFVESSPATTKIGVVSFSGNSFINQDISEKKEVVKGAINSLEISAIEGTDIYEVVITSSNLLKGEDENGKAIVLISDGQMNVGEIEDAIDYAKQNDIIINTIAIGTKEGGETPYGISKLNEDTMKALAYNTEGNYFSAEDKGSLIESMQQVLKSSKKKVSIDVSSYLILAATILFILDYILVNSRYRLLPF